VKVDPRSIREEGPWLAWLNTLDDAAELRALVLEAGESAPIAGGLVAWLIAKKSGHPDLSESKTRAKYRRLLAELGPPPTGRHRQAGAAGIGTLAAAGSAAAIPALAGHPTVALAATGLLVITRSPGDELDSPGGQPREAHVDAHVLSIDARRHAHHLRTSQVANAA
jgi:hypothetical protein